MIEKRVREYIEEYRMIASGDRALIGLSGGADSAALFHILRKLQKSLDFRLLAVHVNHGLRGAEAARDQEFVENLCKEYEVPLTCLEMPVREMAARRKIGLEEAGREARREAFRIWAKKWRCNKLALAHHKNDQAETMLHHLARGAGLSGLAGLSPTDGFCIRPLLCLERQDIEHYLQEAGFAHVEDSSNRKDDYTRNRIRHGIVTAMADQVNVRAVSHMAQTAEILRQTDDYLKEQGRALLGKYQKEAFLPDEFFRENPVPAYYGLREFLDGWFRVKKDIGADHYKRLLAWTAMPVGKVLQLPHKIRARREYGGVFFYLEGEEKTGEGGFSIPLKIPGETIGPGMRLVCRVIPNNFQQVPQKTYTKWLNYDKIKNTVKVRTRQPGDYLAVNASGGKKKLKDYLIDCKAPRQERDRIVLVAQGSEVLWAVGYRLNESYKIMPDTREALELVYEGGYEYEG